jgi:hypothetical protein
MTRPDLKSMKEAAEAGKWPEIKPLEWIRSRFGGNAWRAHSLLGIYKTYSVDRGRYSWVFEGYDGTEEISLADNETEAKAAAQADCEQRIRSTFANPTAILSLIEYVEGLEAKAAAVLEADEAFRRHLPEGTERDPVTLACDELRAALNGGAS